VFAVVLQVLKNGCVCGLTSSLSKSLGLQPQGKDSGCEFLVFVDLMVIAPMRTSTPRTSYRRDNQGSEIETVDTSNRIVSKIQNFDV
jgi:hypothetical protein